MSEVMEEDSMQESPATLDSVESGSLTPSTNKKNPIPPGGSTPVTASKRKKLDRIYTNTATVITPDEIIEYQWPANSGQYFVLQEQISEYLDVKSFKRKYPEIFRRPCETDERNHLYDEGLVALNSNLIKLGMTALKSDEVMELMSREYPDKYCSYISALDSRRQKAFTQDMAATYSTVKMDKSKLKEFVRKVAKSASEYNEAINKERREERRVCMDLQTYTIHFPIGLGKDNKQLKPTKRPVGKYPVALLPGQYTDNYVQYTPQELKYLPLNTVMYGPLMDPSKLPPMLSPEGGDDLASDDSDSDSCSGSSSCCSSTCGEVEGDGALPPAIKASSSPPPAIMLVDDRIPISPHSVCFQCHQTASSNKMGLPEGMIHCSKCDHTMHPSCIDLPSEVSEVVKTYSWMCGSCKLCVTCNSSADEEKMMFCDKCDRGYHSFCVGLTAIPTGKWVCSLCSKCGRCGTSTPTSGSNVNASQWKSEIITILTPDGEPIKRSHFLCVSCHQKRSKKT